MMKKSQVLILRVGEPIVYAKLWDIPSLLFEKSIF